MDTQTTGLYLTLLAALGFLTILLALFVLSVWRNYRSRIAELRLQVVREIESIDRERDRISTDLHDELGTGLSAVGLFIRKAQDTGSMDILTQAMTQLQAEKVKIKEIAFDLTPRIIQTEGLAAAVNDLLTNIRMLNRYTISVVGTIDDSEFLPAKSIHLYRILREIITNVLKHANATIIDIRFYADKQHHYFAITDNGIGFTQVDTDNAGMGLKNINSRTQLLHGQLAIESHIGKGTTMKLKIPRTALTVNF